MCSFPDTDIDPEIGKPLPNNYKNQTRIFFKEREKLTRTTCNSIGTTALRTDLGYLNRELLLNYLDVFGSS